MIMKYFFLLVVSILLPVQVFGQVSIEERIAEVFPASTIAQQENTQIIYDQSYQPSGSTWSVSFDESHVYRCLLDYQHPTNPDRSYEMRIGKGGQIYSLKGSFGESIPPQWRNPSGSYGGEYAPWVDEVWQLVSVDPSLNDPANNQKYFIHGAGVYLKDPANITEPFYSVELSSFYNESEQEYSTVNWGQQAHIDQNLSAGFTSSLLYYTKYKNLGDGIIQVDYLIYNFGLDTIGHMNVPWGGIRRSSLDHWFVSDVNNDYQEEDGTFGSGLSFTTNQTNGWVGFSSDQNGMAPSLAVMVNNDAGVLRMGDAGTTSNRDYTVMSVIRNGFDFPFGESIRIRNYFILDETVDAIQSQVAALDIQNETFFGFETKAKSDVASVAYFFSENGSEIFAEDTIDVNALELQLQPYENSYPLFIIKGLNSSGVEESRITSNPYSFSDLPYDGKLIEMKLIGFCDSKKELAIEYDTIPYNSSYTFADGNTMNNIIADMNYTGLNTVNPDGYEQYVQTNLFVEAVDTCNAPTSNVRIKIFLEGDYTVNGMHNMLFQNGLMPLSQPYNDSPWSFASTATVTAPPANTVDWVLVEAYSGTPSTSGAKTLMKAESQVGLLLQNGDIVNVDGSVGLNFQNLLAEEEYYFIIRHRNHLDVLTAIPLTTCVTMNYDFTQSATSAFGIGQVKMMPDGKFALHGGDYNHDAVIQVTDYDGWRADPAILNTYQLIDGNLDGTVQISDYNIWFANKAKVGTLEVTY